MKLNRIIYLILLFMSFIFVYFYGGKIPYMFFYLVITLPIVSIFYTILIYFRFKYEEQIENNSVLKGTKTTYTLRVYNKGIFLYPYIHMEFFESGKLLSEKFRSINFSLLPFGRKNLSFGLDCRYRGIFGIGVRSVEFRDLLGIFSLKHKSSSCNNITVYPNVIRLESFSPVLSLISESNLISGNIDVNDMAAISEIRTYSHGDSLKSVHWKLTSKLCSLMVKRFCNNYSTDAAIYLDLRKNSFGSLENVITEDKLIEAAISIIHYCLYNRVRTRIVYLSDKFMKIEADNPSMFHGVYDAISQVSFSGNTNINELIERYSQNYSTTGTAIIVTSKLDFRTDIRFCSPDQPGRNINLVYISQSDFEPNSYDKEKKTFESMAGAGINIYSIGINDDIKKVLERR